MQTNYNSLSSYLSNNFSNKQEINEGLLDGLSKLFGKSLSKSETKDANKKVGFFGALLAPFSSKFNDVKKSEDPFISAYEEMAKKEAENEKKRLENELKAEQDSEIARMKAEFDANQRQLDLASQNKVKAYEATKKRLDDAGKKLSNTKLLYSAKQQEEIIQMIRTEGKDIATEASPLKKMEELAMLIYMKEDGTVRSGEEVADAIENNEEIKKYAEEYNKLAQKHKKTIIESSKTKEFLESYKAVSSATYTNSNIDETIKNTEDELKNFEEGVSAYTQINKLKKQYKDTKDKIDKLENSPFKKELGPDEFKTKLKEMLNDLDFKQENGNIDPAKLGAELEKLGIDSKTIDKIKNKDGISELSPEKIGDIFNSIDNEVFEKASKEASKTIQTKIEEENRKFNNMVNFDDDNLSNEEKAEKLKKYYEEIGDTDKANKASHLVETFYNLNKNDVEKGVYTEGESACENRLKSLKDDIKKGEKIKEDLKTRQEANKKARQNALDAVKSRADNEIPDDIKDKVEKEIQGIEAGEEFNEKGEIGFYDSKGDWHSKPGPKASDDEVNKYIKARKEYIISVDLDKLKQNDFGVESVKINDDGTTYTIKYKDGTTDEKASKDDAILAKASQITSSRSKGLILKEKQNIAETFVTLSKKDLKEELKKLKESSKPEDKEKYESLIFLFNNSDKLDTFFKDVDLVGDDTLKSIKKAIEDNKDKIEDEVEDNDIKTKKDDYDDVDDEDEDAKDENDYESDEDEEYTDENGETKTRKKKIINPAKEWKRRKSKSTGKPTKNYYNKNDESISADEYKEKMQRYKDAKRKANSQNENNYTQLKNYLLEMFG